MKKIDLTNQTYSELTVSPVVHGRWLKATGMMPPEYFGRHVCSVCDCFAPNEFHGTHEWLSPICPHCGAKMDERKDDEKDVLCDM